MRKSFKMCLMATGLGVLLNGCSSLTINPDFVVEGPVGGPAAIEVIHQRLGAANYLPIVWYGPKALEACAQTSGSQTEDQDFRTPDGGCHAGITGDNVSIIGWEGTNLAAWTSLTHEVLHQVFGDQDHENTSLWLDHGRENYTAGTVVGDINLELLELNL